jgi:hypothetical protein
MHSHSGTRQRLLPSAWRNEMIWETRGGSLYAERAGKAYLIHRIPGRAWILRYRFLRDTGWEVLGEYSTQQEAKDAAT